jgi:hypothetical protein
VFCSFSNRKESLQNLAGIHFARTLVFQDRSIAWLQADVARRRWAALGDNVKKTLRVGLTAAVLTASMACSNNSTTAPSDLTSGTSSKATFNVAVRPSPITATRCTPQCPDQSGSPAFAFSADMTIDVQASASVGATLNSMTLTVTADSTTFAPLAISSDDIKRQVGTNHVDGHTTISIPLAIVYNTPSGKANLSVSVSLQITDDRNNQVTATGQASVL